MSLRSFDQLVRCIRRRLAGFHDRRTGKNKTYTMEDIAVSAFSVFYTQCPSFLASQKTMQQNKGRSNAQTLFQIEEIPSDNHVRDTLDEVPPEELYPIYDEIFEGLRTQGVLRAFQTLGGTTPIALDGTWYFSSQNIHCDQCTRIEHSNDEITYYHSAITPVIVAPGQKHAIALRPEFIAPQDGHAKQDCETAAAKRWLDKEAARYLAGLNHNVTYLGDDLYAHQPFCRRGTHALAKGLDPGLARHIPAVPRCRLFHPFHAMLMGGHGLCRLLLRLPAPGTRPRTVSDSRTLSL